MTSRIKCVQWKRLCFRDDRAEYGWFEGLPPHLFIDLKMTAASENFRQGLIRHGDYLTNVSSNGKLQRCFGGFRTRSMEMRGKTFILTRATIFVIEVTRPIEDARWHGPCAVRSIHPIEDLVIVRSSSTEYTLSHSRVQIDAGFTPDPS